MNGKTEEFFVINLKNAEPKISIASIDRIATLLKADEESFRYDYKVFRSKIHAEEYLSIYKLAYKHRIPLKKSEAKYRASMLLKKRYMIQTILGEKKQTYRISENTIDNMKKVRPGEIFRFYDQTFFILVKLTKRSYSKGITKYEFKYKFSFGKNEMSLIRKVLKNIVSDLSFAKKIKKSKVYYIANHKLAPIVGCEPISKRRMQELFKEYIKSHKLVLKDNRSLVSCDKTLRSLTKQKFFHENNIDYVIEQNSSTKQ